MCRKLWALSLELLFLSLPLVLAGSKFLALLKEK